MKNFEYAQPRSISEAIDLIGDATKETAILAGGTDLVGLMKRMVVTPDRVVNISEIDSLRQIQRDDQGNLWIGAAVSLDQLDSDVQTDQLAAVKEIICNISSIQLQSQGTVVGELLRRPACWYFRDGHGLLAGNGQMVVDGDNRYHAILGNRGPAKFVNASRLAPSLIALGAQLRIVGPKSDDDRLLALTDLYQTPGSDQEAENVLQPGQLVTHVIVPPIEDRRTASYEVRHGEGPDQPLAAAAVSTSMSLGCARDAMIVLGQVAPQPWIAQRAAESLEGQPINEATAQKVAIEATAGAVALSGNEYKIQLAQVAVKRAILKVAGIETGGLDRPASGQSPVQQSLEEHLA